jgi:dihydrofolate synthase / folylpolyglutamate synthase
MADHATSTDPAVQTQLDRFAVLSPGRDILGLERIAALMAALGNPQDSQPPVFHVAGTNGKGSTCAFLRAAIEAAGMSVHVYTSPHLVRFNERIRVAGKLIEDEILAALLAEVLDVAETHEIGASFFEVTTAAAFLAFARTPADAAIIEVGLGGRLDATNIISRPAVCGIASLGIDHEAFLLAPEGGVPADPLCRIGWEKAGIAKFGVPIVTSHYRDDVNAVIAAHTASVAAPMLAKKVAWDAAIYDGQNAYRDAKGVLKLPLPRMPGIHQAENAALAAAMLRHQDAINIPEAAIAAAMEWAHWPARLQALGEGPLRALLPEETEIWLDGGHNVDAGLAVAKHFADNEKRIHLIIGMLANKDPAAIIAPLLDRLASITVVPVRGHEHHSAKAFSKALINSGNGGTVAVNTADNVALAMKALHVDPKSEAVLICGSLYLAGIVLSQNDNIPT